METRAITSNQSALSRPSFAPLSIVLMLLLLWAVPPAHAAKVTTSALFGWNARAYAAVWCAPNAPPAAPSASGSALGTFSIPGTPPNGLPLPPACNPATFANGAGGNFWRDISSWGAAGGDTVDGSLDLLSMLTPVSSFSTGSFDISATVLDANSVLFDVKYFNSDSGSGTQQYWYDYVTNQQLADPQIQIGESGEYLMTITDSDGWDHIVLEAEGAAKSLGTPEPASLALLGSAVLGAGGYLRRRFTKAG